MHLHRMWTLLCIVLITVSCSVLTSTVLTSPSWSPVSPWSPGHWSPLLMSLTWLSWPLILLSQTQTVVRPPHSESTAQVLAVAGGWFGVQKRFTCEVYDPVQEALSIKYLNTILNSTVTMLTHTQDTTQKLTCDQDQDNLRHDIRVIPLSSKVYSSYQLERI